MRRLTSVWAPRLAARINPADAERVAQKILRSVDDVSGKRWEAAVERAATIPGELRPDKVNALIAAFARELGASGAAVGAAAATPAVGTTATLLATTAELAFFTTRAGDLILTMAALHGRPDPTVEERRAWVLAVLIYGGSARDRFAQAVNEASTGVSLAGNNRISLATLQSVNRIMAKVLIRRYGAKRGAIAIGRALPLGIGALIGGGANYTAIRSLGRHADEFFARLPYSAIDVDSTDVTGRLLADRSTDRLTPP